MATNETNQPYTENDLISLGKKLATLDLTDSERAALGDLISDDDVGGFGRARFDIAGGIRIGFRRVGGRFGARHGGQSPAIPTQGGRADWTSPGSFRKPERF